MKTLIKAPMLFDAVSGQVDRNKAVLIEDGKILKVEMMENCVDCDAQLLDFTDQANSCIMPGLIDTHLHLAHGGFDAREKTDSDPLVAHRMYHNGMRNLLAGVTTQRDCGAKNHIDIAYREGLKLGLINGPRTLVCGQPIVATGGHCTYMGRQIDGATEAMKAVREQLQVRADFIKLMVTGGVSTSTGYPTTPQMTREEIEACVRIAHNNEKSVAVHGEGGVGIDWALAAGIDTLEHGIYLTDKHIEQMVEQKTWYVPTLYAIHSIAVEGASEPVPLTQLMIDKCAAAYERHAESFKRAYAAGVKIAGGTDYKHGVLVKELILMTSLGMKNVDALFCVTRNAAHLLKLDAEIGTLEAGKRADIVVVSGDPTADVKNLWNVRAVIQSGREVVRDGRLKPNTSYLHYPIQ